MRLRAAATRWLMPLLLLAGLTCGVLDDPTPGAGTAPVEHAASSPTDLARAPGPVLPVPAGQDAPCDELLPSEAVAANTGSAMAAGLRTLAAPPVVAPRQPLREPRWLGVPSRPWPSFGLIQAESAVLRS